MSKGVFPKQDLDVSVCALVVRGDRVEGFADRVELQYGSPDSDLVLS